MSFKINTSQLSSLLDPFYQNLQVAVNSNNSSNLNNNDTLVENRLKNDNSISGVYLQFLQDLNFQPLSRNEISAYMKQRFSGKKSKKNKADNFIHVESDLIDTNNSNDSNNSSNNATLDTQLEENATYTTHVDNTVIRKQHLDKIVDYITYYPQQYPLNIDIGYHPENKISTSTSKDLHSLPGNLYTLDFSDLSSLYVYIASLYRYELDCYIQPAEQSLLVSNVLDIDFNSAINVEATNNIYNDKSDNIEWSLDETTVKNTWGNSQFVLEILNTHSNANKDYFISIFQLIDPALLKNKEFLTQAFEYEDFFLAVLEQKIIKPMEALELSLDRPHAIKHLWENYFSTPFENASINPEEDARKYIDRTRYDRMREFNELSRHLHPHFNPYRKNQYNDPYMDDMIDYGDLSEEEIEQLEFEQELYERSLMANNKKKTPTAIDFEQHEQQLYKDQLKNYTKKYNEGLPIKQFFIEHIFSNDDRLNYFLGNSDEITNAMLKSIPPSLKNSERLFLTLLENARQLKIENTYPGYDINEHIPKDFFDNPETAKDRKNAYLVLSLDYLDHCSNLLSMPWFKTKNDILDTLNNFTKNNLPLINRSQKNQNLSNFSVEQLDSLYSVISYRIKDDFDIMKFFIEHNKKYFEKLPKEYQNDTKLISHYLSIGGSIHNMDAKTLFSLPEKQLIINYIATNKNYIYLNHIDCPTALKTDPDMLRHLNGNIVQVKFTASEKKTVYANVELFTEIVRKEPSVYSTLPIHLKESLPITLSYLNNVKHKGSHSNVTASFIKDNLSEIVLSYDKVCLTALMLDSDFAPFIPLQHWNNRSFVRSVLKSIDHHELSSSVLNSLPPSIKQCFSVYQVESNYLSFFNKFLLEQDMQKSLEHIAVNKTPVKKKKI